jgi:hypothetical protein
MIHILDEIVLAADDEHQVLALLESHYLPSLAARPTLSLLNRWMSPPVLVPGQPNTLWLLWQVESEMGYYAMRGTAGAEIAEFWARVDGICQSRRRHVMTAAGAPLPRPLEAS